MTADAARPPPHDPNGPRRPKWPWLLAAAAAMVVAVVWSGWIAIQRLYLSDVPPIPDQAALWSAGRPAGVTFLGPDGQVVARRGPRHGRSVDLAELPAHVPMAFLAAEDKRFYLHGPIDARGVARATAANLRAGRAVEGGSTLSQQLARTLFLSPDKTFKRKLQEAVLAARLERMLTKDEIFQLYLDRIYFGDGAYGLTAAAERYFGKAPAELTLSEAALLAALPKAPSRLALTNDMPAAWRRAQAILAVMAQTEWIEPARVQAALSAGPPPLAARRAEPEGDMAWALDAAVVEAQRLVGDASPDLVIRITVDPAVQAQAARSLRAALPRSGASQGALVALAPDGAIRALVGGLDHSASPFNRALQARRQPGSAFKPFVWAAALEHGVGPYDVRDDRALTIDGWSPRNYGGRYRGAVTVERALRLSLNTVSVRLAREAGVESVAALARRFGLDDIPERPGPSLALGAYEVSLLQLASAYQVFQAGGGRTQPYLVSEISNARGDVIWSRAPGAPVPIYGQYQAGEMVRMMQGVIASGTGTRAALGRPAAGKTGTSQNHRDAWFVGFTPDWVCGVWVGDDDNRPMRGVTGGELPAAIWRSFMTAAHKGLPARDFDWAPELTPPPPPLWFDDSYEESDYVDYAGDDDEGRWSDDDGWDRWRDSPPRREPSDAGLAEGYGREAPYEARIWPPDAPAAERPAQRRSRPTWSQSVPF